MPTRFKRLLSIMAITAIAMHTVLWGGTAARGSAIEVDPFSVICHSGGNNDTVQDQAPTAPLSAPSHACDHCNLCGSAPSPAVAPPVLIIQLLSTQPAHAVTPASTVLGTGLEVALKGARGPPVFA